MRSVKLIAGLIVAAILVVFGAQNTQVVTFHFLTFTAPSVPMVLVLFLAALLGVLLGWIISVPGRVRRMRQRRELRGQVAAREQQEQRDQDALQRRTP